MAGTLCASGGEQSLAPSAESQRRALADQIGADGRALEQAGTPAQVQQVKSVQLLRQVWQQSYEVVEGQARWRAGPQAREDEGVIRSPYDAEARTGKKREIVWLGYKVQLTETCQTQQAGTKGGEEQEERAAPPVIVQVQTRLSNEQDVEVTASIQHELAHADLLPDEQVVDTGDVDGDVRVRSQRDYGIGLVGPVVADTRGPRHRRQGLRPGPFPGRLAEAGGDLSARPVQLLMVGAARPHRSEVCPQDLCRLPLSPGLHACHQRWPDGAFAPAASA